MPATEIDEQGRGGRWVTGLLLLGALWNGLTALAGDGGWLAKQDLEAALAQLVEENHAQRLSNRSLSEGVEAFAEDRETLEWLARTRLGFIREGERVYRFEASAPP